MQNKIKWITFLKSRVATYKNVEKKYEAIKYLSSCFSINDLIIHFQKKKKKRRKDSIIQSLLLPPLYFGLNSVYFIFYASCFFSTTLCLDIDSNFVNNLLGFFPRSNLQFQVWIFVEIWSIPFPTRWYLSLIVFFFFFFFSFFLFFLFYYFPQFFWFTRWIIILIVYHYTTLELIERRM